jgi:NADH:ubiquinone oxidoreductase subunit 2 (subunit N)
MFYLLTYAVMNIGAFAVVQLIARRGDRRTSLKTTAASDSNRRCLRLR